MAHVVLAPLSDSAEIMASYAPRPGLSGAQNDWLLGPASPEAQHNRGINIIDLSRHWQRGPSGSEMRRSTVVGPEVVPNDSLAHQATRNPTQPVGHFS